LGDKGWGGKKRGVLSSYKIWFFLSKCRRNIRERKCTEKKLDLFSSAVKEGGGSLVTGKSEQQPNRQNGGQEELQTDPWGVGMKKKRRGKKAHKKGGLWGRTGGLTSHKLQKEKKKQANGFVKGDCGVNWSRTIGSSKQRRDGVGKRKKCRTDLNIDGVDRDWGGGLSSKTRPAYHY